ncbi:MAG: hypothetical protein ACRC62_03785 [Microcoleus sp.]
MTAKLTHEFVQLQFQAKGYKLLDRYESSRKKMEACCLSGHRHFTSYNNFSRGHGCAQCAGQVIPEAEVRQLFEDLGYTLISPYEKATKKLDFICNFGHRHKIKFSDLKQGIRCAYCTGRIVENDYVKKYFRNQGYKILSDYKNAKTKIECICPNAHRYLVSWNNFKSGVRCSFCEGHVTENYVKQELAKHGYKLLSSYTFANKKLDLLCPENHFWQISWTGFNRNGTRCAYCAKKRVLACDVKNSFESAGYTLLSVYKDSKQKLQFKCPNEHLNSISWANWQTGHRCGECQVGGYSTKLPGRLYYVRFYHNGKYYYKIGITNKTIKARFKKEPTSYVVLMDLYYDDGRIPPKKEAFILSKHKKHIHGGRSILRYGNSELFTKDVLGLDSDQLSLCELVV